MPVAVAASIKGVRTSDQSELMEISLAVNLHCNLLGPFLKLGILQNCLDRSGWWLTLLAASLNFLLNKLARGHQYLEPRDHVGNGGENPFARYVEVD